jgi:hypothetical protein
LGFSVRIVPEIGSDQVDALVCMAWVRWTVGLILLVGGGGFFSVKGLPLSLDFCAEDDRTNGVGDESLSICQ